jgi:hypothetical protein
MAVKRGAFAVDDKLADIDDLMPGRSAPAASKPKKTPATQTPDPAGEAATPEADQDSVEPDTGQQAGEVANAGEVADTQTAGSGEEPDATVRPKRRRATTSVPTAEVAPNIHRALSILTNEEKAADPITARTFAQVVLDAIEANQDKLKTFWKAPTPETSGGGLFSRLPAAPARRRRHPQPPARVPLTGMHPTDAAMLDSLVEQWGAPSRSALVEQALRLYEPLWLRKRAPKKRKAVPKNSKSAPPPSKEDHPNDNEATPATA